MSPLFAVLYRNCSTVQQTDDDLLRFLKRDTFPKDYAPPFQVFIKNPRTTLSHKELSLIGSSNSLAIDTYVCPSSCCPWDGAAFCAYPLLSACSFRLRTKTLGKQESVFTRHHYTPPSLECSPVHVYERLKICACLRAACWKFFSKINLSRPISAIVGAWFTDLPIGWESSQSRIMSIREQRVHISAKLLVTLTFINYKFLITDKPTHAIYRF